MKSKKPCVQSKRGRCWSNCGHLALCYVRMHADLAERRRVRRGGGFTALSARSNRATCMILPLMFILCTLLMSLNVDPFAGNKAEGWSAA